jgi:flavin reductase (DIM6/NTAB) family NADH-FMN oxidoreductase RutF
VTGTRLIGPIPAGRDPEAYDRQRRRILWALPTGLYVLGSRSGGQRNLMTISWAVQVATEPKLVAVSVEAAALTHRLVGEGRVFSLNVIAREDRAVVRKFVKPLHDDGNPSELAGFPVTEAATGAPILDLAALWLDCRVVQVLDFTSHSLFVGEVVDCGGGDTEDLEVLRMEDTRMSYGG